MKKLLLVLAMFCISSITFASTSERATATSDQVVGSTESAVGGLTGNEKMKAKGKTKKLKGDLCSTKEDVKDKAKDMLN